MPCGENSALHHIGYRCTQIQQTERIGNRRAGLSDAGSGFLLGQGIVLHQFLIAAGFFHRIQVFALKIFHQCQLRDALVVRVKNADRNLRQSRQSGRTPATLSRNGLIISRVQSAYNDRLDQAVPRNGCGEILQPLLVKVFSRLVLPGLHLGNGKRDDLFIVQHLKLCSEQRLQADAETAFLFYCHVRFPSFLFKNSSARAKYALLPLLLRSYTTPGSP